MLLEDYWTKVEESLFEHIWIFVSGLQGGLGGRSILVGLDVEMDRFDIGLKDVDDWEQIIRFGFLFLILA